MKNDMTLMTYTVPLRASTPFMPLCSSFMWALYIHTRGVQRHHYLYLYLFNQQNDLSLYLHLDRRPEVGVVYTQTNIKSGTFFDPIFISDAIVVPSKHHIYLQERARSRSLFGCVVYEAAIGKMMRAAAEC